MQRNKILVCFLIVFLAFSFVTLVYAAYIFSDGQVGSNQETAHDFATWTANAGMTVVAASPHHGSYSFLSDGATDNAYKSWTAITQGNIRAYVNFTSLPGAGVTVIVLDLYATVNSDPRLMVYNNGGTMQIGARATDNTYSYVNYPFVTGTWYCLELQYVQATKTTTVYVDGDAKTSKASAGAGDTIERGYIGFGVTAAQAYYDCVVMDSAYIGVEGGAGTSKTFQGNFSPTFTFGSIRTWSFQMYRTMSFTFALNHWNIYDFSNLHSFSVSFSTSLNRFVNLNTQNTFGLAFTLNQLRTWQFTTYRTILFQLALNSIQNFAYTVPGLLTFYGDITTTFTMKALKEIGFTTEQTIPFAFGIQSATTILQLGVLTIWSSIGFTFQTLSSQYGLAEITLDYAFALAGLAFILAITGITITLVRRKGE